LNLATYASGITWNSVQIQAYAISMVHLYQYPFVYDSGCVSNCNTPANYGGGSPVTVATVGQVPGTASAGWPNGYENYYMMRYLVSQGQYVDFLNSLPASVASTRYLGTNQGYGSRLSVTGGVYAAVDRNAAANFLGTLDLWGFLSWSALRPITEMEYERAGRDISPDNRIYPWGNTIPTTPPTYAPPNEGGGAFSEYYMDFNNLASQSVLDVGRYMSMDVYRSTAQTGASPYGIADLAGNVWEQMLNCTYGTPTYPSTGPVNGNGTATAPAGWPPGTDGTSGLRGGAWNGAATVGRVSDRILASWALASRYFFVGGRGGRTP
jgi:formylglycine-generating enzyme required for sulfatase activity